MGKKHIYKKLIQEIYLLFRGGEFRYSGLLHSLPRRGVNWEKGNVHTILNRLVDYGIVKKVKRGVYKLKENKIRWIMNGLKKEGKL
ncbi:MAG: hypothetical protein WC413_01545 [Candidatus Nanoarchaeia archaeon]